MNTSLNAVFNAIASKKASTFFFLLRLFTVTLVCYDLELDCCLKKILHGCKVFYKERVLPVIGKYLLGLPTMAYVRELEEEIEAIEKQANELILAFGPKKKEIARMKDDLLEARTQMEWLYEEFEDLECHWKRNNERYWMAKYSSFVENEENLLVAQQLEEAQGDDMFVQNPFVKRVQRIINNM